MGSLLIGETEQKNNRFLFMDDFENCISAVDNSGYHKDNVVFTGWLIKLNTPEFNWVKRAQYGRGIINCWIYRQQFLYPYKW